MYNKTHARKAFSLLELIFVITILGIVASIGSSIVVKVYESYIMQRSIHNASIKTELAINQLANRLIYRIDTSVVARRPGNLNNAIPIDIVPLDNLQPAQANTHTILEWIGYDNDGFSTQNPPAWSGFTDLAASNFAQIRTTGSNLNAEIPILQNLFLNMQNPALIFATNDFRNTIAYNAGCLYNTLGNGCIFPVNVNAPTRLNFTAVGNRVAGDMIYSEFYKLAASAYAVVPMPQGAGNRTVNNTEVWDLILHFDYQPWEGENYLNGIRSMLLHNVSVFRFTQEQNSVRIKLCTIETIGATDISICKEKAVIR